MPGPSASGHACAPIRPGGQGDGRVPRTRRAAPHSGAWRQGGSQSLGAGRAEGTGHLSAGGSPAREGLTACVVVNDCCPPGLDLPIPGRGGVRVRAEGTPRSAGEPTGGYLWLSVRCGPGTGGDTLDPSSPRAPVGLVTARYAHSASGQRSGSSLFVHPKETSRVV